MKVFVRAIYLDFFSIVFDRFFFLNLDFIELYYLPKNLSNKNAFDSNANHLRKNISP